MLNAEADTKLSEEKGCCKGRSISTSRELKQTTTTTATRTSRNKMSKTIAVHVRHKSLYISSPQVVLCKKKREMIKYCVVYGTWTTTANFSYFYSELNAVVAYLAYRTNLDNREFQW